MKSIQKQALISIFTAPTPTLSPMQIKMKKQTYETTVAELVEKAKTNTEKSGRKCKSSGEDISSYFVLKKAKVTKVTEGAAEDPS